MTPKTFLEKSESTVSGHWISGQMPALAEPSCEQPRGLQSTLDLTDCIIKDFGERAGGRTLDLLIKSQLLYQLSYTLPMQ